MKIKTWHIVLLTILFWGLFTYLVFGQEMTYTQWKSNMEIIKDMVVSERMFETDSAGIIRANELSEDDMKMFYDRYVDIYRQINEHYAKDIYYGTGWSAMSGIGLGMLESHAFGYQYPSLDQDGWFQNWLTMDTSGDQLIKVWHPNKLGREINDVFDRLAYERLEKFYGKWYWAYMHHFVVKNTTSTMYRGWAKYGKPFYYFYIEFDLDWFLYRVFGVGE